MKKIIAILVIVACCQIVLGALSRPKAVSPVYYGGTGQQSSELVRTFTANGTLLDTDEKTWTYCMANFTPIPSHWSWLDLSIYGYDSNGAPDGNEGKIYVYGCEYLGGARLIEYGTFVMGAVRLSHNPVTGEEFSSGNADPNRTWADTYTPTGTSLWTRARRISGGNGADPNGNLMSVWFDRLTLYGIEVVITDVNFAPDGNGLNSITVIMNGGT